MSEQEKYKCPHCDGEMNKWRVPENSTWGVPFLYVCFNDECSYFIKGWDWIREKYKANASYRYCVDPVSGNSRPLPVWSAEAMRDGIIDDDDNS